MSFGGIEQICKDVDLGHSQGYLYLTDRSGEIIYHPRQQLIYAGLLEENNLTAAGYTDGTHTEKFQGQTRQVTVKTVGYAGWKLVAVVPSTTLWDNYGQIILFFLFVVLLSVYLLMLCQPPAVRLDHRPGEKAGPGGQGSGGRRAGGGL